MSSAKPPETKPLHTQRLSMIPWTDGDLDAFYALFSDPQVMWWGPLQSKEEAREMLERFVSWNWQGEIAAKVCLKGREDVLGNVCLKPAAFIRGFEVAYHFSPSAWGNGYAAEGVTALCAYGQEVLGLDHVYAAIVPDNIKSAAVVRRCDFVRQGRVKHSGLEHHLYTRVLSHRNE